MRLNRLERCTATMLNDRPCWDLSPVSRGLEPEPNPMSDQNTINIKKLKLMFQEESFIFTNQTLINIISVEKVS